ncbi:unnamed protein product [Plutella xylostella]|uniref:(diamondback moth) hypothetical protein n=1 Tax=Plutella xylostella TaxID=51655 RepID=A0A8S4D1E9_PLUXY|nr:unnamed protein product [Plutella xylostella]
MAAENQCCKVETQEHIAAYLENRELVRELQPLTCDARLVEQVASNYIIVKRMLGHLPWQDQMICKSVCKMWCDAVQALQRELQGPVDFVYEVVEDVDSGMLKSSGSFSKEPMAVIVFTNFGGFCKMGNCTLMSPRPCMPACSEVHWMLDFLDQELCFPKDCDLIVRASYLCYMPLASSPSSAYTINRDMMTTTLPFICGIYIPKIPNVQYEVVNIKTNSDMKMDFFDVVDRISSTRTFKGILVFVTDKYMLNSIDDITFLNHFKKVQPETPYALGGCIIEDTMFDRRDLSFFINNVNTDVLHRDAFISENVVSVCMFTVPKTQEMQDSGSGCNGNFEMFSLIIESSDWSKPKILSAIKEFAENIDHFEHSLVFKLSCIGRDERHDFEQKSFRTHFPTTPLIGCYGNGELGVNHPPRPEPKPKPSANTVKRQKRLIAELGLMYSYSTVFVYMGWGKIVKPAKT